MKKLILIICSLVCLVQQSIAQVEFVKRDELSKVCLYGVTHITDKEDNTYLLSNEGEFINGNYMNFDGSGQSTYTLYKIAPSGEIIWQSHYPDYIHAQQILDRDSVIVIVYSVNGGFVSKSGIEGATRIPYYTLIGKSNGVVIEKAHLCYYCTLNEQGYPFYFGAPDVKFFKAALHKDNSMSCIQTVNGKHGALKDNPTNNDENFRMFESFDVIDTTKFINKLPGPQGNDLALFDDVEHDEYDDKYIIGDSARLSVYDRSWKLMQRISLPGADTLHYPNYKIACNSKYYLVNFGSEAYGYNHTHFTSVITKTGKIISTKESVPYEVSGINKHNMIYAVAKPNNDDTTARPVHLISMNIKQNRRKDKHIGPAYTRVNSLSFTGNNELILTGTCMTTGSQALPKTPNGIYYYKESLRR